jgi:hypothetical protein
MRGAPVCLLMLGLGLSACGDAVPGPSTPKASGRYAGIGTYDTGRLWGELAGANASSDPAAAKVRDDEHVIVVIDSHTGEVRQCGDYSGFCVTMNPWSGDGPETGAPVKLAKHAADLAAEDQAASEAAIPAE